MRRLLPLLVVLASVSLSARPAGVDQTGQAPKERDLNLASKGKPLDMTPVVPRGYALIVGISNYKNLDASKQLRFPESDAEAFHRVLISQVGGAFPSENVHVLSGSKATLANIKQELEQWLPSVAQPADRVVVYFAGHGFVQNGKGFLAPYDVDPDQLERTAYAMSALGDVLANKVGAGWKVLLTDACHSGKVNAETTNDNLEAQFKSLPTSFLTLTATTERESSFEDPQLSTGFGFFTYYLVQAFSGYADYDPCDGKITADELIEYVRSNVRRYARERQLSQTPTARGDYEPGMLLGVANACMGDGSIDKGVSSMLGTAVIESNMDDVDVYVDGRLIGKISKGKPMTLPGLSSGLHEFRGEHEGYEPDRKELMIAPDQETGVSLRIRYVRKVKKPAEDLNAQGEKLLFTRRSSMSLMNLVPVERKQSEEDLKKAAALFEKALQLDPSFAIPAYHLGQVNQLLLKYDESVAAFRRAIAIDQTHVDARIECAAVLIEQGDPDEAIRELTEALRLESDNDVAYSMMARAYWDKGAWQRSVESAEKALGYKASNAQAHLWRADSLRQMAAASTNPVEQLNLYASAREGYRTFLDLTNFSTGLGAKLAFHFIGMGVGSRKHADRQGAYDSLRSAGFLGLCLSEQKVGNPLKARDYCKRALQHAPNDPIAYFLLGNVNRDLFNERQSCTYLKDARSSYTRMLAINPHLAESNNARNYVGQIDGFLPQLKCGA
jgi:tetratricopeptide (TPR) repeat protein